jgi:hypothetical protein
VRKQRIAIARRSVVQGRRGRAAWLGCVIAFALSAGGSAWGQEAAAPASPPASAAGSITITSRPTGANVRLVGGPIVTGHTPLTISRGLLGPFQLEVSGRGYETWKRRIYLDGMSADSVHARLSPKHIWWAGLRSTLMPGWGQFYSERPKSGWTYISLGAAAGGVLAAYQIKYNGRVRQQDKSYEELQSATTPQDIQAAQADYDTRTIRVDEAAHQRNVALAVLGVVWSVNLADALVFFRGPKPGGLTVAGVVQPGPDGAAATLAFRKSF